MHVTDNVIQLDPESCLTLSKQIWRVINFVGRSPSIGICVMGETSTGKEVVAKEVHRLRCRSGEVPFDAVNSPVS